MDQYQYTSHGENTDEKSENKEERRTTYVVLGESFLLRT